MATPVTDRRRSEFAFLDAEQDIVGAGFLLVEVERLIGCKIFDIVLLREPQQHLVEVIFLRQAVPVEFYVIVVAEQVEPPHKSFFRLTFTHIKDKIRYFAGEVSRGGDQIFAMFGDQILVNPRIDTVEAFNEPNGTQPGKVEVAVLVLCQQHLRITLVGIVFGELQFQPFFGDKKFATHDRLYFLVRGFAHKFERPIHIADIGKRHRGHIQRLRLGNHRFDVWRSLQHRVLRVCVQVAEWFVGNCGSGFCQGVARKLRFLLF